MSKQVCVLLSASFIPWPAPARSSPPPLSSQVLVLFSALYIMVKICARRLPAGRLMDLNLLFIAVVIPLANVNFCLNLPGFHVERRNWLAFSAILLSLGAAGVGFTLPHLLLQWVISTPVIM